MAELKRTTCKHKKLPYNHQGHSVPTVIFQQKHPAEKPHEKTLCQM